MPRNTSLTVREAVFSQETSTAFLTLLTVDHENLDDPLRFTSDAVDTVSRNDTYTAFPFKFRLPAEESEKIPEVTLTIDNVSREITSVIRNLDTAPDVDLEIVTSDDPDTVEAGPFSFKLKDISYDRLTVEGKLKNPALDEAAFPADTFNPSTFPGLFKNV